jgi:hypothetical protein
VVSDPLSLSRGTYYGGMTMAATTARKRATKKAAPAKAAPKKAVPVPDVDEDLADLEPVNIATVDQLVSVYDIEKETPGTQRFKEREPEEGGLPATGILYLKKTAFRELGEPSVITVTIVPGE